MGAFENGFTKAGLIAMAFSLLIALPAARAEILLKDSFDGDPYSDNAALVVGPNQIGEGIWSLNNKGQGEVTTSSEIALSLNRSLALICPSDGDQAQAVARFSVNGQEGSTAQALTAKFSFNMPESGVEVVAVVRSGSEDNLVNLTIRGGGAVKVAFGDRVADLGRVEVGKWYQIVLSLPANPGTEGLEYSVILMDAEDHSEIGSAQGALGSSRSLTEYRYLSVYLRNAVNSPVKAFFDDFEVQSEL